MKSTWRTYLGTTLRVGTILIPILSVSVERSPAGNTRRSGNRLPPPPAVRQSAKNPDGRQRVGVPSPPVREYIFQAPYPVRPATPGTRPVPLSREPRRALVVERLFRVQVSGSSPEALSRIRTIEPFAFIRPESNTIQAGIFQQPQQAERRARELASLGFTARVISLDEARPRSGR